MDALKAWPDIKVVGSLQGDWTEQKAYETTRQWLANHQEVRVDLVFGANDRTAMGARRAFSSLTSDLLPLFCGIDGLPGKHGGIQLVRDSLLDASYIYPTHGDQIIDLAVSILEGQPYQKETMMMSALVTRDNATVLSMETEEIMRQADQLDQLHRTADTYLHELDTQRLVIWLAIGFITLLIVALVLFYQYHISKISRQREHVVNSLWNMEVVASDEEQGAASEKQEAGSKKQEGDEEQGAGSEALFITRFKEAVESRLSDSDISVEDLAADMNLSRVQLYRRVKAVTGSSPVELLRTARLKRAYQLLITTDKSVSEVAYAVGFSAPSYFTKCFKDEYGMLPGEVRN